MPDNPVVSVVIPVRNRERLVTRCVASLQSQTFQRWEAIVVDDGSFDGTGDVVEGLAREDSRITLIRLNSNRGAQAARNTGIRASRGLWVAFLDSDDQFLPQSLQVRLAAARETKSLVVHSECLVLKSDGSSSRYEVRPLSGWVYRELLRGEGPVFPSLLVIRSALERIGHLDERVVAFQEWDTAIRLARHYEFAFVDQPTFIYDRTQQDSISKDWLRGGMGYEQVIHKHFLAMLRYGGPRVLARHYLIAARWYHEGGSYAAARRCHVLAKLFRTVDIRTPMGRLRRLVRQWLPTSRSQIH
jgi:glycosyltransferase involved in cell wall biosynthesis